MRRLTSIVLAAACCVTGPHLTAADSPAGSFASRQRETSIGPTAGSSEASNGAVWARKSAT
jgi:hypothetical protein